jgi:uncharacterized protein (TIGR02598 family)
MILARHTLVSRARLSAFSLAEVLLAMAITSFALLTLLAVLPEGLNSLQDAQKQAAEARIVQQLTTQFQALPWSQLDQALSLGGSEVLFDADGNRLMKGADNSRAFFRVRLSLVAGFPMPNETVASPYFRRLKMEIRPNQNPNNVASSNTLHTERFASIVNLDKADPPSAASPNPSGSDGNAPAPSSPNP